MPPGARVVIGQPANGAGGIPVASRRFTVPIPVRKPRAERPTRIEVPTDPTPPGEWKADAFCGTGSRSPADEVLPAKSTCEHQW
ncbi:MAG: hypothetical protein ACYCVN_08425 [Acidimicrobiales bacterium]